jgi:hypothetical protein
MVPSDCVWAPRVAAARPRPMSPSTISLDAPKWFRIPSVPRQVGSPASIDRRLPPADHVDRTAHPSCVSQDAPPLLTDKHTAGAGGVVAVAPRHDVYEVFSSVGQALRGLDITQRESREVGEPRGQRWSPVQHDRVISQHGSARGAQGGSAPGKESLPDLERLFSDANVNLVEAFKSFDQDGSGTITTAEFEEGLRSMQAHGLIQRLSPAQVAGLGRELDHDGSGALEYAEFHRRYGAQQSAGALVRRHKCGNHGDTEGIVFRRSNHRRVGLASDAIDVAARSRPSFVDGYAQALAGRGVATVAADQTTTSASQRTATTTHAANAADAGDGPGHRGSPTFGLRVGYGARLSEMMLVQKQFLPVQEAQERTTLRVVSPTPSAADQIARTRSSGACQSMRGGPVRCAPCAAVAERRV